MENSQNIDRTHNYLLEDERKILEVLRVTLEKAESFCASSQYSLLSLVHNILLGGIPNEETMLSLSSNLLDGLIKDFGWELFDYIHPFLISTNGSIEECSKVRKVASSILSHIGDVYSFRDLHMIVCERLSFIDWDTCFPDEEACLKSAIQSVEIFKQLGKVFERATGTKRIDDFILYPVKYCARTLSFLERILCDFSSFGLSKHKQSRWDDILLTLTNSILDFIEYGSKLVFNTDQMQQCKPETFESNDMMRRRYLFVYLLALLFEKIILNLDMELSKKYYSRFHSRYNIRTPSQTQEIHQSSTKKKSSLVSDMIFRSTKIATLLGVTFDEILQIKRYPSISSERRGLAQASVHGSKDMEIDEDGINCESFPLSYNSIVTMLAIAINDLCLYDEKSEYPCLNVFPLGIDLMWVAREFTGIIMNLLTNSANGPWIDKGLLILLYLSDNVEAQLTLEILDKKIKGPLGDEKEFPASRVLEIISSVASLSDISNVRFLSHQLISSLLEMCSDEVRMFAFTELLERCPYPSMKTASIGLFKNQINGAFNSKKDRPPSVFASPVIVDKFFPILFRTSKKWCTEEDTFWDDYSYQMQALNLYLFLLICDKSENRTTVFDQEKQVWMNNEYIHHLEVTIDTIMERHKKDSNDSDEQQSGIRLMNLEMMKNVIEQIKQRMTLSV